MKKIIIFIVILNSGMLFSNDWKKLDFNLFGDVESIICYNHKDCNMLFSYGGGEVKDMGWRLYKTTNKGNTFELIFKEKSVFEQDSPMITNLMSGVSPDSNHYFIAAFNHSVIIKSSNGGKSFKKIILDGSGYPMRSLGMYDSLTGFVYNQRNIFVTNDGWENFQTIPKLHINQNYYSTFFKDSNIVYMIYSSPWIDSLGESFEKYNLSNNTWDTIFYFPKIYGVWTDVFYKFVFVNDSIGYACGHRGYWKNEKPYDDVIYKTTNGGYHWEIVLLEAHAPQYGLSDIAF